MEDPISQFIDPIAAAVGVTPDQVNLFFPNIMSRLQNAFSFGATNLSGINEINALLSEISGLNFPQISNGFPADFAAASSSDLNTVLALAGQPLVPNLPPPDFQGFSLPGVPNAQQIPQGVQSFQNQFGGLDITGTLNGEVMGGTAATDIFFPLTGDDILIGGAGVDLAIYQSPSFLNLVGKDQVVGPEGQDFLVGVDRIQFADGVLALNTFDDPRPAQIVRLYEATLDRPADFGGLGFYIRHTDVGLPLEQVAFDLINSAEFAAKFGTNLSNQQFINQIFFNITGQPADLNTIALWNDQLNAGMTRPQLALQFSESIENVLNVAPQVDDGIWFV